MKKYLVVDLDSTLIKTDLLHEAAFIYLKANPLRIFQMLSWLICGGKVRLKAKLSDAVAPNVDLLPFNNKVLEFIEKKRADGYLVGLASASPQKWVDLVAHSMDGLNFALGSTDTNLKGHKKHQKIAGLIGTTEYLYIGDCDSDLEIWEHCRGAVVVNPSATIIKTLKQQNIEYEELVEETQTQRLHGFLKQLRVHQWAKNFLLFLPMLAAHKFSLLGFKETLLAFVAFSLAASSVYVLNDLVDIEADRNHHSKKNRPLASGIIPIRLACFFLVGLFLLAISVAVTVNINFLSVILFYFLLNFIYTFYLKKEVILDIILLSGMYTLRLFGGSSATAIVLSDWLLTFSTLFFFSLACVKRYTELVRTMSKAGIQGRGYNGVDQIAVMALGVCAGLLSILVALLYIQSDSVNSLYSNKQFLWLITPILLYWIGRVWLLTGRNEIHDDPVVFAMKDPVSLICGLVLLIVMSLSV
jgi:4-hydroxybenzoate polyprenyltransferase/phosphoserine phosphatase